MLSPPTLKYGEGDIFPKKSFQGAQTLRGKFKGGLFYISEKNQIMPRANEFHKMRFLVIWTL